MKEAANIRPVKAPAIEPNRPAASRPSTPPVAPDSSDATVAGVKPELSDATQAAEAAKDLANKLASKGLDALPVLDPARIQRLLADD